MKTHEVDKALRKKFVTEDQRLVFWHDADGEFAEYIGGGLSDALSHELGGARLLDVAQLGGLAIKLHLETEDTAGKYLVYSQGQRPKAELDWLLDIRLYSSEFTADIASLWLQELGLAGLYLRDHLKARSIFLGAQDRRQKLKRLLSADDDESSIDLKMMAVLAGSPITSPFAVLRALCHGHLVEDRFALDAEPAALTTFSKMGLSAPFWELMQGQFGYSATAAYARGAAAAPLRLRALPPARFRQDPLARPLRAAPRRSTQRRRLPHPVA